MGNILITGSSGLIGTALKNTLEALGHEVYPMPRTRSGRAPFYWLPSEEIITLSPTIPLDAVIHLAGENIAAGRWTAQRKQTILESRQKGTALLAGALARLQHKPRVFLSGAAIGFYGNRGNEEMDEAGQPGTGFLADVCRQWEQASLSAANAGIRTLQIRIGVVLSPKGGMLKKVITPFKWGLGGVVGNGNQYISWVTLEDICRMVPFLLENETISGPVNLVSPNPVTNREFTKTLGSLLHRPTIFPLPAFAARLLFGQMADDLMLSSTRVKPGKLMDAGYDFVHPQLNQALTSLMQS